MSASLSNLAASFELLLAFAGAILLWRLALSPAARAAPKPIALDHWDAPATEFLVFILFVIGGSIAAAAIAGLAARQLQLRGDAVTVFSGAAAQLGMLAGVMLYRARPEPGKAPSPILAPGIFLSGATTFLVSLPIVLVASKVWELLLDGCGLPTDRQSLIGMFANAESRWLLVMMIALAIGIAPLTEELVFRAGLFRYLRTRVPRWLALVAPSLFFACLHVNWSTLEGLSSLVPLVVLAVVFSLAYERTGRIGTPIVAHALFNLNTIVLIVAGVGV